MKRPRGSSCAVLEADRQKARKLLASSFQEGETSEALATELEGAVLERWGAALSDYRAQMRSVVAALRRSAPLRHRLCCGEVDAARLLDEPELLLTEQQRAQQATLRKESLERCLNTSLGQLGLYVLGIDCDGSSCSIACERRHLESREQMRGKWPKLQANHLVICAGPERSGSTWLYNAVRRLHLKAQVPCDSYWMTRLSHAKLEERLRAQPLAVVLVKTHEWSADYAELVPMAKHIFLTHRDLRGVVASYRRVQWELAIPDAYVSEHMEWRRNCSLDISYEEIMRSPLVPLKLIAEQLKLSFTQEQLREVQSDLIQLKRSHCGNAVCQVTKLWPDHRSAETERLQGKGCAANNAELNELKDEAYAQVLNTRFKEYQMLYGYLND